jgi:hypothetical protein
VKYDHSNVSVHLADKTSRRINDVTITHADGATTTLRELLRVFGLFIFASRILDLPAAPYYHVYKLLRKK